MSKDIKILIIEFLEDEIVILSRYMDKRNTPHSQDLIAAKIDQTQKIINAIKYGGFLNQPEATE